MDAATASIAWQQHRTLLCFCFFFFPLFLLPSLFLCAICVGFVYSDTSGRCEGILVADTAPAVFLSDGGEFKCTHPSLCWLPRINLLALISVESSCQDDKKSFPLLLSSSPSKPWHFHAAECEVFTWVLSRLSLTNWINLSFNLRKKRS